MLSFKDLQELLEPKAAGEKRFKDKHVVGIVDHPLNDAETLKGTKKSPGKKKRIADSEEGKDAAVYEENITKCKCENCGCEDCECEMNEESLRATYGESWKAVMFAKQICNESVIDKVKEIASKKSAAKIDGVMVDSFTASAISQIYDKVNDATKKKMEKLPIVKLATGAMKMMQKNEYVPEEVDLDEALNPKDKQVVDAFYSGKSMNGKMLSTDGKKLEKTGMGGQTIASKSGSKFKIVAKMDSRSTQDVVKYIEKSFPKNVIEEVDLDEASNGLPPHLAKFLDKKGNLNPDAAKRMAKGKSKKDVASRTKDVTPKGYGPNEELEESAAGIAKLKKAYEPMRDKKISLDNAKKLSAIMNKFADNKAMLIKLVKADIPFVTQSAVTKLITKHNMKGAEINKMMKEGNAFGMALKAAKEKGDKTFVVAGKTYEVYESVDLDEAVNFSATDMKLKDGSTVKVSKDDAAALNNLYKSLNPANTKTMLAKFMQDKKSNSEILAFAKQAM